MSTDPANSVSYSSNATTDKNHSPDTATPPPTAGTNILADPFKPTQRAAEASSANDGAVTGINQPAEAGRPGQQQ